VGGSQTNSAGQGSPSPSREAAGGVGRGEKKSTDSGNRKIKFKSAAPCQILLKNEGLTGASTEKYLAKGKRKLGD